MPFEPPWGLWSEFHMKKQDRLNSLCSCRGHSAFECCGCSPYQMGTPLGKGLRFHLASSASSHCGKRWHERWAKNIRHVCNCDPRKSVRNRARDETHRLHQSCSISECRECRYFRVCTWVVFLTSCSSGPRKWPGTCGVPGLGVRDAGCTPGPSTSESPRCALEEY